MCKDAQHDTFPSLYICFKIVAKKETVFHFLVSSECIFPGLFVYYFHFIFCGKIFKYVLYVVDFIFYPKVIIVGRYYAGQPEVMTDV